MTRSKTITVTHCCGHTQKHTAWGNCAQVDSRQSWLEDRECYFCQKDKWPARYYIDLDHNIAVANSFKIKEQLKELGYKFCPGDKVWKKKLPPLGKTRFEAEELEKMVLDGTLEIPGEACLESFYKEAENLQGIAVHDLEKCRSEKIVDFMNRLHEKKDEIIKKLAGV